MLGVTIHINDRVLTRVSCVNEGTVNTDGETKYSVFGEDGDPLGEVWHDRDDGALELTRKILEMAEESE